MTIPKELTTITPLSKLLTLFLLLSLPFVGFLLGLKYQQQFIEYLESRATVDQYILKNQPATTQDPSTANWKTYKNTKWKYQIRYPPLWNLRELDSIQTNLASQETTQEGSAKFFIDITVGNRNSRDFPTLEEEARAQGAELGECPNLPNAGICAPLQPKTISKKSFTDGSEYYLVITVTDKKIAIIPIPLASPSRFIEIKSVIWPKDEKELFDQIFSTFQFTN